MHHTRMTSVQRRAQGSSSSWRRGVLRNLVVVVVVAGVLVVWTTTTSAPVSAFTTPTPSTVGTRISHGASRAGSGYSSPLYTFYNDFEEFDKDEDDEEEDEEEDDDEEDEELDEQSIADFRAKMGSMFGTTEDDDTSASREPPSDVQDVTSVDELIQFARSQAGGAVPSTAAPEEWAKPVTKVGPGTILVANPEKFCQPSSSSPLSMLGGGPNPSLLAKFGLTRPPPKDLGPDRQADLLPVLVVVEKDDNTKSSTCRGVLLNRRTGYLLGDLEQPPSSGDGASSSSPLPPILEKFCIQPLWFGGIDNISTGLDMLHLCPAVPNAQALTEDGLYWGGDPAQAQEAMEDPSLDRVMTGFDFKFFVQSTIWSNQDLQQEIQDQVWFPVSVSKEILFKSRDRMGTQKAKPLWTEIMELLGGNYQTIKDQFYDNDDDDNEPQ